jgi:hypothetical protein
MTLLDIPNNRKFILAINDNDVTAMKAPEKPPFCKLQFSLLALAVRKYSYPT